jgi:hypothetical protein
MKIYLGLTQDLHRNVSSKFIITWLCLLFLTHRIIPLVADMLIK